MTYNPNMNNTLIQTPPPPVSTQSLIWTTPSGYFPTNFNNNIFYRNISSPGSQLLPVYFRAINATVDTSAAAADRIVVILNQNGDQQDVIFNHSGWAPVLGYCVVSAGSGIDVDSLQVGI